MAPKFEEVHNPSLIEEPRYEPAKVIPVMQEPSLIDWLEASGRLSARESTEDDYSTDEPDTDFSALIDVNDHTDDYDDSEEEEMLDEE